MAMFCSRPIAIIEANIDDPPYETSGRGTPVTGMMPRHIPMFWKVWKANQQAMPAAATRPNMSSACMEMCSARHSTHREEQDQHAGADQAELLAGDGEDEVGVLLGHEARTGLRAVEETLPEQAAVADRDPRLGRVVAGTARVEGRDR